MFCLIIMATAPQDVKTERSTLERYEVCPARSLPAHGMRPGPECLAVERVQSFQHRPGAGPQRELHRARDGPVTQLLGAFQFPQQLRGQLIEPLADP
jgi:hypothetical protein